jgi:NAD(P)-dependent dehydrogenase (short-subunit alcohol dehydrogenase family)
VNASASDKDGGRRVALVSGANRGIGLAVVDGLCKAGLTAVMGSRERDAGEAARESLGLPEGAANVVQLDVADPDSVAAAIAEVERDFGRLDVLVNNAGVMLDTGRRASDPDIDAVRRTLEVNLFGAWRLTLAALPLMRAGAGGLPAERRIINVSSGMGQLAEMGGGTPGYRLSKVSINALTRMLSAELGDGFSVNSVCPGWVRTDMGTAAASRSPEQGADTIVWLATLPAPEAPSGGFFRDRRPIPW